MMRDTTQLQEAFGGRFIDQTSYAYQELVGQRRDVLPRVTPRTTTSSGAVAGLDDLVQVDATSGPLTQTLETAVGCPGRRHVIKKVDASGNAVTVACTGAETIDGAAAVVLAAQYDTLEVISNGTIWRALSAYPSSGGGGGTTINSGSATLDFGAFPGSSEASVAVAAPAVAAGTKAWAYFRGDDTATGHTAADHRYAAALVALSVEVAAGVGLTIYGRCLDAMQGQFTVRYGWFN